MSCLSVSSISHFSPWRRVNLSWNKSNLRFIEYMETSFSDEQRYLFVYIFYIFVLLPPNGYIKQLKNWEPFILFCIWVMTLNFYIKHIDIYGCMYIFIYNIYINTLSKEETHWNLWGYNEEYRHLVWYSGMMINSQCYITSDGIVVDVGNILVYMCQRSKPERRIEKKWVNNEQNAGFICVNDKESKTIHHSGHLFAKNPKGPLPALWPLSPTNQPNSPRENQHHSTESRVVWITRGSIA